MINIYDSANQLAQDLTKTDQYKAVGDAVKAVQADSESAAMFKKMDELQAKIMANIIITHMTHFVTHHTL